MGLGALWKEKLDHPDRALSLSSYSGWRCLRWLSFLQSVVGMSSFPIPQSHAPFSTRNEASLSTHVLPAFLLLYNRREFQHNVLHI